MESLNGQGEEPKTLCKKRMERKGMKNGARRCKHEEKKERWKRETSKKEKTRTKR